MRYELCEFTKCKAVVVGNNDYRHAPHGKLDNCIPDAVRVATALKAGQFPDAKPLENLDRASMFRAVESLSESDFTWFHFSGHGVLYEGEVYLVPVDSERNEDNIRLKSVLERVRKIERDGLHIFTLDMCQLPSSQRGPMTMEAIERVLELEPTSFNTRGRLSQILGVPERGRYKFSHEIWVYTAGETGFAVADNGYFSTAIARFAELLDLGPEYRVEHPRKYRYIITKRSEVSLQRGQAEHELAGLAAIEDERFYELRRAVEMEAARRCNQPGDYCGIGWTPPWSLLQAGLSEDEGSKVTRAKQCLIILDGLIGCGKTTFLRKLQENHSENIRFVTEPVGKHEPDTWWSDLHDLYRVMRAGNQEEKIAATFKLECKVWQHHFRVATERQTHTFTERGLGSTARVFCKVCTEDGLLTEGQREYFLKAYEKYSSDESLRPTLILYFKLPTHVADARIKVRADREDREFEKDVPLPYLERLYCAYDEFLSNHEDVIVVDSNNPPEDMMVEIAVRVEEKLRRRAPWLFQRTCRVSAPNGLAFGEHLKESLVPEWIWHLALERDRQHMPTLGGPLTKGAVALIVGHARMWEHLLRSKAPWGIFMEDDLMFFHPGLETLFGQLGNSQLPAPGKDWDYLQIQGGDCPQQSRPPLHILAGTGYNTGMYILTIEAAKRAIQAHFPMVNEQLDNPENFLRSQCRGHRVCPAAAQQHGSLVDSDVQIPPKAAIFKEEPVIPDCPVLAKGEMLLPDLLDPEASDLGFRA
ncbi:unnamed protein product [Symbiodinium sp. KB8]|nr:unnamed protein product [Symbiodinium sp. KB8]